MRIIPSYFILPYSAAVEHFSLLLSQFLQIEKTGKSLARINYWLDLRSFLRKTEICFNPLYRVTTSKSPVDVVYLGAGKVLEIGLLL